jgi:hypothetical protein
MSEREQGLEIPCYEACETMIPFLLIGLTAKVRATLSVMTPRVPAKLAEPVIWQ